MRNQEESALLRLPGELRNTIYRLALDTAYLHLDLSSRFGTEFRRTNVHLPLVSRQTYVESVHFLDTYTVLCLETLKSGRGSPHYFLRILKWQKQPFEAVRKLQLSEMCVKPHLLARCCLGG